MSFIYKQELEIITIILPQHEHFYRGFYLKTFLDEKLTVLGFSKGSPWKKKNKETLIFTTVKGFNLPSW